MAKSKREGKVTQKSMVEAALGEKGWGASPLPPPRRAPGPRR